MSALEITREAYASVFMVVQTFLVSAVSAIVGLLALIPQVLVLVVPPLVVGLGLFFAVLARTASRQRASLLPIWAWLSRNGVASQSWQCF